MQSFGKVISFINACVAAAIEHDRIPSSPSRIGHGQGGDAAEDSTILAASEVKKITSTDVKSKSSSLGAEGDVVKTSAASADCHISTATFASRVEDSGEVCVSLADSTILTASKVEELPRSISTDVMPEGVEGEVKKASAASADCHIPTASSTSHAEDITPYNAGSANPKNPRVVLENLLHATQYQQHLLEDKKI